MTVKGEGYLVGLVQVFGGADGGLDLGGAAAPSGLVQGGLLLLGGAGGSVSGGPWGISVSTASVYDVC